MSSHKRARAVKDLFPSELKVEWKKLGRRAMKLWRVSGGVDPEIDVLFKRMDAIDRAIGKPTAALRRPRGVSAR